MSRVIHAYISTKNCVLDKPKTFTPLLIRSMQSFKMWLCKTNNDHTFKYVTENLNTSVCPFIEYTVIHTKDKYYY